MIFVLSLICASIVFFGSIIICFIKGTPLYITMIVPVVLLILVVALFCLIVMLLLLTLGTHFGKTYNPKSKIRWLFMRDVAKFSCFWLGVRPIVNGLDKIPLNETVVFYCNHESYLDMFILYVILSKWPHATMYKKVIDTYPLARGMAKALGGVAIDREDDKQALRVILTIIKEVNEGVNFLIFPEGTRAKQESLNPYKAGSFKVVQKTKTKAVLLALDGTFKKIMTFPFIPTPIYFNVVDVLDEKDYENKTTNEIASLANAIVQEDINKARRKYKFLKYKK